MSAGRSQPSASRRRPEAGMTLIEMMIAIAVLATGMAGVAYMIGGAVSSNSRNKLDTSSTLVAQMVLEQIAAQPVSAGTTSFTLTDCAATPTNWSVHTNDANAGAGTGATLSTSGSSAGSIDWSQTYANVTAGYKMRYVACGTAGHQMTYDVRWNVTSLTGYTNLVTVSARQQSAGSYAADTLKFFAPPVTLRTIAGNR